MARTRMSWNWVGRYPVFVYTTFVGHGKFHVKVVLGKKGNQNEGYNGPKAPAYFEYTSEGIASKDGVVDDAFRRTREHLTDEGRIK